MAIETLEDIVEEMADRIGVYGEDRSFFVSELYQRIKSAAYVEHKLAPSPLASKAEGET